ncbi:MAG: thiamine pyrophosphate-binding protein [Bacillota bacterium]
MRIAEAILRYLKVNEVEYIFGISAGTVSAIFDAVNDVGIKPIITKNEAGAAYAAVKYASASEKLGVCIAAGGVGTNNMINGIADAMRSKIPTLIITGYVHRWQIGKGAIQELDTKNILKPITKYSQTVLDEKKVLATLQKAIQIALTPPYGPVHISIPIDIQVAPLMEQIPDKVQLPSDMYKDAEISIKKAIKIIDREKHGLIMVGKGCRGLSRQVMDLSEHLQWPIITTPQGKGVVPADFYLNLGNYGFAGTDTATNYVESGPETCLLILGSSLGESSTRNYNPVLVDGRKVIHVDWDEEQLGKVFNADVMIHHDLSYTIPEIIKGTKRALDRFNKVKIENPYIQNHTGLSLRLFLDKITKVMPTNTYYVSDIGEYMNFLFKYMEIPEGGDFEISLNYGAMGSGVAGVIGTHLAQTQRPVAVFTGDGSFFMNGSEILTAKEYRMPILYFVINNAMLGYVENGHRYLYGRTVKGFKQERISISAMMNAVGVKSMQISELEEIDQIKHFVRQNEGPWVIELITDGSEAAPVADRFKALEETKNVKEEKVC